MPRKPQSRPQKNRSSEKADSSACGDHLQARRQANVDGEVDAADEREGIETAAAEFKQHA
jgi:hypothetical protein